MSTDRIWRRGWDLGSLEYELAKKEDLSVLSIIQSLCALAEREIGQMSTVEVYTHTLGDDTALQGDLSEEGRKEELYQFIVQEEKDLNYIYLYVTLHGYDDRGNKMEMKDAMHFTLYVEQDGQHLLLIRMNTDIFAPFYYEETHRSMAVAEKNLPRLKAFLQGVETTFEGKWDLIDLPAYMDEYFWENGMTNKMEDI